MPNDDDYDVEQEFELAQERARQTEKKLLDLRKAREASQPKATRQTLASLVAKNNQRRMTANGMAANGDEDSSGRKKSVLSDAVSRLNMRAGKEPQAVSGSRATLRDIVDKSQAKRGR